MSALDRRTFLRGLAYGLLGAILGWEIEVIAAEAAPEEAMVVPDTFIDDAYADDFVCLQVEGIAALDRADGGVWTGGYVSEPVLYSSTPYEGSMDWRRFPCVLHVPRPDNQIPQEGGQDE